MEFLRFLKWHWDGWSWSHRVYMLGFFFVGLGIRDSIQSNGPNTMMQIGFSLWLAIILKWLLWDTLRSSWAEYKEHRNSLLTTIKNSDE